MEKIPVTYKPKQHADLPRAWRKAAGILRAHARQNVTELKKTRRDWNKRVP
jgi:hypothetical protein